MSSDSSASTTTSSGTLPSRSPDAALAALHDAHGGIVQLRAAHAAFPTSISMQGQLERDEEYETEDLQGWYVVVGAANEGDVGFAVVDLGLEHYAEVDVEPDEDDGIATIVATTAAGARLEIVAIPGEEPG